MEVPPFAGIFFRIQKNCEIDTSEDLDAAAVCRFVNARRRYYPQQTIS